VITPFSAIGFPEMRRLLKTGWAYKNWLG